MDPTDLNLKTIADMSEDEVRAMFECIRWPRDITCAHCGGADVTRLPDGEKHRAGLFQCNECREQFTVTVGTIMHRSKMSLKKWLTAFFLMCSSKKGVSALQLQRQLGIGSYQTAWHLAHRIRHAMVEGPLAGSLGQNGGVVEVDETYVGGKPRKGGPPSKRGRGTKKTPVLVLVDRGGKAHSRPIKHVDARTLKGAIREMVDPSASVYTDELWSYYGIGKEFQGGHHVIKHGAGEYSRGPVNTNAAESYFALLKRGMHGSFHHVSRHHLHRYCNEFSFRWNRRSDTDGERTVDAIRMSEGRRLTYRGVV
jgi:transposase-like protein